MNTFNSPEMEEKFLNLINNINENIKNQYQSLKDHKQDRQTITASIHHLPEGPGIKPGKAIRCIKSEKGEINHFYSQVHVEDAKESISKLQELEPIGELIQSLLLLSRFSPGRLCATPSTAAHQAPPSLGFSRQEHQQQVNKCLLYHSMFL